MGGTTAGASCNVVPPTLLQAGTLQPKWEKIFLLFVSHGILVPAVLFGGARWVGRVGGRLTCCAAQPSTMDDVNVLEKQKQKGHDLAGKRFGQPASPLSTHFHDTNEIIDMSIGIGAMPKFPWDALMKTAVDNVTEKNQPTPDGDVLSAGSMIEVASIICDSIGTDDLSKVEEIPSPTQATDNPTLHHSQVGENDQVEFCTALAGSSQLDQRTPKHNWMESVRPCERSSSSDLCLNDGIAGEDRIQDDSFVLDFDLDDSDDDDRQHEEESVIMSGQKTTEIDYTIDYDGVNPPRVRLKNPQPKNRPSPEGDKTSFHHPDTRPIIDGAVLSYDAFGRPYYHANWDHPIIPPHCNMYNMAGQIQGHHQQQPAFAPRYAYNGGAQYHPMNAGYRQDQWVNPMMCDFSGVFWPGRNRQWEFQYGAYCRNNKVQEDRKHHWQPHNNSSNNSVQGVNTDQKRKKKTRRSRKKKNKGHAHSEKPKSTA